MSQVLPKITAKEIIIILEKWRGAIKRDAIIL